MATIKTVKKKPSKSNWMVLQNRLVVARELTKSEAEVFVKATNDKSSQFILSQYPLGKTIIL